MNATRLFVSVIVVTVLTGSAADAQRVVWCAPALHRPLGVAPDACGPGFYWVNHLGAVYGPAHYLRPPFPPTGTLRPGDYEASMRLAKMYQQAHGNRRHGAPYPGAGHPGSPYPQPGSPYGYPGSQYPHPQAGLAQPPHGARPPIPPSLPNPPHRFHGKVPPATFPSHRFARSPRDFFMWNEVVEDEVNRFQLPGLVP